MNDEREYTIRLHPAAPEKPAYGAPCNRCGVCCAAEPCPIGRLLFARRRGQCPALDWDGSTYACALIVAPERHLTWLPKGLRHIAARVFARSISAGKGCDSADEVVTGNGPGNN
ncbi:hypothetical protein [Propionivibrio dicarboxylicus]|uniref:4Fe-4S ferredoxin-type domain-containing protein n=1 Tax=Propionivibrio dicarboxylicus TaxID=83767 RepID=A0A1G8K900_9RHOO|nr:hypothetical protein [Propionivibrio dicarboxylicus]SDI39904.1 hypothetical protein SAMN05660652_03349 [Propionivibrio dicarboxylicus]